jgi:titin
VLPLNVTPNNFLNGAVLAGDRLVIGGGFTQVNGQAREASATLDDTGTGVLDPAMDSSNTIEFVTLTDGQVVLGGDSVRSLGGVVIGNVAYGPQAPASVTASATRSGLPLDGELDLSWTAAWSGTFPLQGYRIEMSADGGVTWTTVVANTGNANTSRTITGLTSGTAYSFRIASLTRLGDSTSAASTPVAPVVDSGAIRGSQTQLSNPAGLARDSVGRLYAANQSGADAHVTVYAPNAEGNVPPVARLTRPAGVTGNPVGLSLLPNGEVWVSYNSCFLARFAALAPSASGDISPEWVVNATYIGSGACQGIAIDPSSGEILLVRGANLGGALITLPVNAGGVVGSSLTWTDNVSAVRTTSGISYPYLLSLDSSGNVFVTDDTTLVKIPRQANGALGSTVAPLQRVTGMYWPRQTVRRSDGSLVVTELNGAGNPTLNVFAADAEGAATPIQVTTGSVSASTTDLNGVALSADELTAYVTSANNAITWLSLPALQPAPNPGPGPGPGPGPEVPGAPRAVTATAGAASAIVAWQAPSNPGSYPITSYQVVASPGGATCMTSVLTCTVKGLTNGTKYTFRAKALSGAGWGQQSAPSNAVTPSVPPQPNVTLTITGSRDGRKITVSGASTGLSSGAQVTPWLRVSPTRSQVRGRPVALSEDGSFEWSRRVRDVSRVWVHFTADGVKSNVLSLRR